MRNHTRDLDLESPSPLSALSRSAPTPDPPTVDLHQVHVYALGVDSAGQPTAQWQTLEAFWTRYLRESGACLDSFTVWREPSAVQVVK